MLRNRFLHYFIVLILLLLTLDNHAQLKLKQLSNIDGLSNNSINCIFQDSQNTLWIGTWDGLNNYDARNIKTYRYNGNIKNSISNNIIRKITEDKEGNIWIATDYGINKWNKLSQSFERYFAQDTLSPPSSEKSFFVDVDAQGTVYCAVREYGVYRYRKESKHFEKLDILPYKSKIKNFLISKHSLYVHMDSDTLLTYSLLSGNMLGAPLIEHAEKLFCSNNQIILLKEDSIYLAEKNLSFPYRKELAVSDIILHNNLLYLSYYNGGCYKYNLQDKSINRIIGLDSLTTIFTIYTNSPDILWIGTDGQGLIQLYQHEANFKTVQTSYPVRAFCENSKGELVVGTKGGGVAIFKNKDNQLSLKKEINKGLSSNSVYCLAKNSRGDIFVGTEAGVDILHSNENIPTNLQAQTNTLLKAVYSIAFTNNDSIMWLGTSGNGLFKVGLLYQNGQYILQTIEQYTSSNELNTISNNVIYSVVIDPSKDYIWQGTRGGGINKLNIKANLFESILMKDELSNNDVLSLLFDRDKNLWIGTSYGLNRLSPDGSIHYFDESKKLINNTIHGILEDIVGNIWVSTNKGISKLSWQTDIIRSYNYSDGLQNNEFSDGAYYKDSNNLLYFGGVSGFNYFNPQKIETRTYEPNVNLTSLSIDNNTFNIYDRIEDNTLKLAYNEGLVSLGFVANEFINNQNCMYAYRLTGFSNQWIELEVPNITTRFSPGKYKLEIKCSNSDRVWSNKIYTLRIEVANPWWLSFPAYLLYLVLFITILYITQTIVRNRIRLNKQLLMEHLERKHQKQINEAKLNFFTNIAHEFFTPLSLIYGPAQYLLEYTQPNDFTRKYLQIIKNNADRMQKLISELMEFRKMDAGFLPVRPEYIDMVAFADYLATNYFDLAKENKINYQLEKQNLSTIYTDRGALEKIVFNLFSNAFKYTPKEGYIHVKFVQENNNDLILTISNSGKGFSEEQQKELFDRYKIFNTPKSGEYTSTGVGLNFTKDLVTLLSGTIRLKSEYGKYASFEVFIPSLQTNNLKPSDTIRKEHQNNSLSVSVSEKAKILIVEDEATIRELLKDILIPYYEINEAENGMEAMQVIQTSSPDLIISDIMMPDMDGIALLVELKKSELTAHIPIINISAKGSVEDHIQAIDNGADLYINKPFHPQHILTSVKNLLQKQEALKNFFNSVYSSLKVENGITLHLEDKTFIKEVSEYIRKNIDNENLNADIIAESLALSKTGYYRKLKELTGKTPNEFIRLIRLEYAAHLLKTTKLTVMEVMYKVGFSNKSYFFREFSKQYGVTPGEYRK